MHAVPRNLTDRFAEAFAGNRVGFSAREITDYFTAYSNLVKPFDHFGMNPTRKQLFIESVYALRPKQQYYALNDLCWDERPSRYAYPAEASRTDLRQRLHAFISPDPIGIRFSAIRETAFREDWASCITRLPDDPASAITAARTMLETLFKTIITERAGNPDNWEILVGYCGRLKMRWASTEMRTNRFTKLSAVSQAWSRGWLRSATGLANVMAWSHELIMIQDWLSHVYMQQELWASL